MAQEALNNISKHARAGRAAGSLNCQGDHTILKVSDNGRGFNHQISQPDELGLAIMCERSRAIGADFVINSSREKGTEIVVYWSPAENTEGSNG
ncbi:MAG: sensor histidine kinase [Candidatus Promineifilaceae bacterium]